MQSYLILGNSDERKDFVEKLIKEQKIKNYNIIKFESDLKIKDAREIKKSMTIKATSQEKKLIVIEGNINIEAQNALLKTLEELPENVCIVISSRKKDNFLPTVISRCKIISLKGEISPSASEFDAVFEKLEEEKDFNNIFSFYQNLSKSKELKREDSEEIILSLRNVLIKKILTSKNLQKDKVIFLYKILEKLTSYYPFIKNNNLNLKIVLDNIALDCLPN